MQKQRGAKPQERLWTPLYVYLLGILMLTNISSNLISTAFTQYAVDCGISLGFAGVLAGLFSLMALVGRPVSGILADTFRQKILMMVSVAGIVASALIYPLCRTEASMFIIRTVHGLFFSLNGTVSMAFASTFIPESRMGEGMGYFGLSGILGQAVAPAMGFALADKFGYTVLFYTVCVVNGIALIMMLFLKDKSPKRVRGQKLQFSWRSMFLPELIPYTAFTASISMINGICSSFLALIGESRGMANVGIFFTIQAFVLFFVRPFSGKLNDRKGLSAVVYPGFACSCIGLLLITVMDAPWLLMAAALFKALGQGMAQPAFQAECIRKVDASKRGAAVSTYYIGCDVGNGLAPVIGGYVADAFGYSALTLGATGIMAACILLFFLYNVHLKKKQQPLAL